jgi:HK97 family phage portal protein
LQKNNILGVLDSIKAFFVPSKKEQRAINYFSQYDSADGMNTDKALTFSAVWAAIRLLSESVSGLPISVYKRAANGDKLEDSSSNVKIITKDNYIYYQDSNGGGTYGSEDVLHFKLITQDGIKGLSPIAQCANAINWGMNVEEFGRKFFTNGASLSGILETDRALSTEAIDRLKNSFNNAYQGIKNSNKTAILEEGLSWKPVSISPEQASFLASRQFSIEEVARIFNMPPHLLRDLSKSSFNNIEMQSQEFVTYTLMPYLTRIEQQMNLKLFRQNELGKRFVEFNVNGLLRGNIKDRSDYYRTMLNIGAMSINEIRRKENMNSIKEGEDHFMQLNMTTVEKITADATTDTE